MNGRYKFALRPIVLLLHRWLGLAIAVFVFLVGLSGAVLVFGDEIDRVLNPSLYHSVAPNGKVAAKPISEIAHALERELAIGWQELSIQIAEQPDENHIATVWYEPATPEPEGAVSLNVAVDPYSGRIGPRRVFYHSWNPLRHCFVGFFFKLHYSLFLKSFGDALVAILALALAFLVLLGLKLWWPRNRKWVRVMKFKTGARYQRRVFDLHQVVGFYSSPFILLLCLSGVYFNFSREFRSVMELLFEFRPVFAPPEEGRDGDTLFPNIDEVLWDLNEKQGRAVLKSISTTHEAPGKYTACYWNVSELKNYWLGTRCYTISGARRSILDVDDPSQDKTGDALIRWQWPLHSGKGFGWFGRALVLLAGLASPIVALAGVLLWRTRREAKQRARTRKPRKKNFRRALQS